MAGTDPEDFRRVSLRYLPMEGPEHALVLVFPCAEEGQSPNKQALLDGMRSEAKKDS